MVVESWHHYGPFERHVREAIALNEARAPLYSELSGGASRAISRRLILLERAVLPLARVFDRRAAPYHRAGIPVLEALFASMANAPPFAPASSPPRPLAPIQVPRPRTIRRRVRAQYKARGFDGARDALAVELAALDGAPGTEYLTRHLLESAHRLAGLAPGQIRLARAHGLTSPRRLLTLLLRLHLWSLGPAAALDARARPLQARGIEILARDLPPVPPPPVPSDPREDVATGLHTGELTRRYP